MSRGKMPSDSDLYVLLSALTGRLLQPEGEADF